MSQRHLEIMLVILSAACGSRSPDAEILRFAQDDMRYLQMSTCRIHYLTDAYRRCYNETVKLTYLHKSVLVQRTIKITSKYARYVVSASHLTSTSSYLPLKAF